MSDRSVLDADRRFVRLWRYVRIVTLSLLVVGATFASIWLQAVRQDVYEPLAEALLLATVTCVLGAVALTGTVRISVVGRRWIGRHSAQRVSMVAIGGVATLSIVLLVSVTSIVVALPHFFRSWPISLVETGPILFYSLAGLIVVPVGVGLALLVMAITAREDSIRDDVT